MAEALNQNDEFIITGKKSGIEYVIKRRSNPALLILIQSLHDEKTADDAEDQARMLINAIIVSVQHPPLMTTDDDIFFVEPAGVRVPVDDQNQLFGEVRKLIHATAFTKNDAEVVDKFLPK